MGGVGSSTGSWGGGQYSAAARDAVIAYAENDPATGVEIGQISTAAQSAFELLAKLPPLEPHLGQNIDIRA